MTTSKEDTLIGRGPQRKMTSKEDNLTGRLPHRHMKITSNEDNLTGRLPPTKTTAMKVELEERQIHRQMKTSHEGKIAHVT